MSQSAWELSSRLGIHSTPLHSTPLHSTQMLSTSGTGISYAAFYVEADKLEHCGTKPCTELGGNCQNAPNGCCTLAREGGAPKARCAYPPDVVPSSACVA